MKRYFISGTLLLIISLSFLSCKKEFIEEDAGPVVDITFDAGYEAPHSISADNKSFVCSDWTTIWWSKGDEIAVFSGKNSSAYEFTNKSEDGKSATFKGAAAFSDNYYAIYPYSNSVSINNGHIEADSPSTQTLSDGKTVAKGSLMAVASSQGTSTLVFRNVFSLISIVVPEDNITAISIEGNNGETLSGRISIAVGETPGYTVVSGGNPTVTLHPEGETFVKGQTCAFTILPVEFTNGFTVVFENKDSKAAYMSYVDDVKAERNHVIKMAVPKLSWYNEWIRTPEQLKAFLANADKRPDTWKAVLACDIDMTGVEYTPASDFKADFNARGYSILLPSASSPLFNVNSGRVRNLTVKPSASFSQSNPKQMIYGVVVKENKGTLQNVENNIPVSLETTKAISEPLCFAGIAAINSGTMDNCRNKAAISAITSSTADGASGVAGVVGYNSGTVKNCENDAALTFQAKSLSGITKLGDIDSPVPAMGGICAYGAPGFSMTECTNKGKVSFTITNGDQNNSNPNFSRVSVGGIVGGPCGLVKDCANEGEVNVETDNSSKGTAYSAKGFIICVGGIGGSDKFFTSSSGPYSNTTYDNCTNNGSIKVYSDFSSNNSVVGGIVGWPGQEVSTEGAPDLYTQWIQGCTNSGAIEVSGTGKFRVGGINGGTGRVKNCVNKGNITMASGLDSESVVGGISGFANRYSRMSNSTNKGNVTAESKINGVGGLLGNAADYNNLAENYGEGCSVNCTVSHTSDSDRKVTGLVIGRFNGTTSRYIGTESNKINAKGKVNGTTLTSSDFSDYLSGSTNYDKNYRKVYSQWGESKVYIARGTIKYNDNAPAVGVFVSDGFDVTVTDEEGRYSLKTCPDTWYIYFSYPSDAKVTRSSATGCPEFFQRYDATKEEYNFTLTRQAVENDFRLVALADPQAHYLAYATGRPKSDTDRFRDESVAAINTALQGDSHVYGVTLGDLVYSEGARNSEPGMTVMRGHCKAINFPVFQTIGNHDYTYCYTNTPISTDATSSTLYLKLQRAFEDCFGPINYSFNRGNVHIVCMRNINFDDIPNNPQTYHGGFTDAQLEWLKADLDNVPKDKMVILCVHIPFDAFKNDDNKESNNAKAALKLLEQFPNSTVFSGHTHGYRGVPNTCKTSLYEHVHSAVCGQWWWSNFEGDGCPNGYTIYNLSGNNITDATFKGVNAGLENEQIRIYKGNMTIGNDRKFQLPFNNRTYLINVFNGDDRWSIKVYENGVDKGSPTLIKQKRYKYSAEELNATTKTPLQIPTDSSQDWWCIGFYLDYWKVNATGFQSACYHMWKYVADSSTSTIKVVATDPYGKSYTCETVISDGKNYPSKYVTQY